jgi:hypothetical protein
MMGALHIILLFSFPKTGFSNHYISHMRIGPFGHILQPNAFTLHKEDP